MDAAFPEQNPSTVHPHDRASYSIPFWMLPLPLLLLLLIWTSWLLANGRSDLVLAFASRITTAGLFCASAIALGKPILARIVRKQLSLMTGLLLSFTTGLILFYHLAFFLGVLHLYNPLLLKLLLFLPALLLLRPSALREMAKHSRDRIALRSEEILILSVCSFLVFYSLLISLNPLTHYDALTNHVAVPMEYLTRGGIERIPYNLHADLPPAAHMINLILIAGFGNAECVQVFNFLLVLFIGVAACCLAYPRTIANCLTGWCIFLVVPQVSLLFSLCNIDFLATLMCIASLVLCLQESIEERSLVVLLALHLSFLTALKYQSAIFVVLLLIWLFVIKREARPEIRRLPALLLLSGILDLPFLLKNYIFTGDPVFPFLGNVFSILSAKAAEIAFFLQENGGRTGLPDPSSIISTFLQAFFKQPEMGLFVIVPAVILIQYRKLEYRHKSALLLFGLCPLFLHALVSSNVVNLIRWVQYSQVSLSILAGLCISQGIRTRRFLWTTLLLLFVIPSWFFSSIYDWKMTQSIEVSTGRISEKNYRNRFIPSYSLRMKLQTLQGRILFIGESRDYFNTNNSVVPSAHNSYYIETYFRNASSTEELAQNLRKDGYRYVFVTIPGVNKWLQTGRYKWMTANQYALLKKLVLDHGVMSDGTSIVVQL